MENFYVGIDTSNYKTSVAVIDDESKILFQNSEYLEVPAGKRGLRQSEAFFKHSCKIPEYINEMSKCIDMSKVRAIGVSTRPRRVEGSYMPCFLAGINTAKTITSTLDIPIFEFSHQEGHAAAIIESELPIIYYRKSLLFHLSGGTTEFLLCTPDKDGYAMEIVGGTLDISIGQLIDRTGVALGLPFPSGSYMDEDVCIYEGKKSSILPHIKIENGYFNLSGAETKIIREIESIDNKASEGLISDEEKSMLILSIEKELFTKLSELLKISATNLSEAYGVDTVYMAGGVASSRFVRNTISSSDTNIVFGKPELSGDNAVGTALLTRRKYNQ